jgi:hypothetical protein
MSEEAISLDPLSYTSYFVECCFNDTLLANGTCFFVKRDDSDYLITNWHVVSGQNNETKEYLDETHGAIPNNLKVHVFKNQDIVERIVLKIDIRDEEDFPMWLEHPVFQEKVDVVAMKITIPEDMQIAYVEDAIEPFNESTKASIKDDVYILGFPFGITEGEGFPIWKRASIASEPVLDIQDRPLIYVDTASRRGMSGSPVIYKERRGVSRCDGVPGEMGTKLSNYFMEFIGVYSGRIGADDEFKAQLGRVWKKNVIDEIINQNIES